jgi:hypothetical protein
MITVPVAAPNKLFQWQSSLFQYAQKKVYGIQSTSNSTLLIVDRNSHGSIVKEVDWNINIPYKIVDGIHSVLLETDNHSYFSAGNLFFAINQIISDLNEEEFLCIIDCDVIPLKKYDSILPRDEEVVTCNLYEDWHMFMENPSKKNFYVVHPYLKHRDYEYMDGGFVPVIIKIKTLKKIINEVIDLSILIARNYLESPFGWWMQMWAFQIACHNNRIKCISQDNTYFPNVNEFNRENHYFAHYSCDPLFKKSSFPNHNIADFPNNDFYNLIREWYFR